MIWVCCAALNKSAPQVARSVTGTFQSIAVEVGMVEEIEEVHRELNPIVLLDLPVLSQL